ncbi:hypothetical protein D9M69_700410 [compost metagenome]
MHEHDLLVEAVEHLLVNAVIKRVLAQGWEILHLLTLQLYAQYVGYIAPGERFADIKLYFYTQLFDILGQEGHRTAYHHFST